MVEEPDDATIKSRREVLKSSSVAVFGLGGLNEYSSGEVEIVLTRTIGGAPMLTKLVPEAWVAHTNRVERVKNKVEPELFELPGVRYVGIGRDEDTIKGWGKKAINVGLKGENIPSGLPVSVEGIQIQKRTNVDIKFNCYTGTYSDLQGGISISSDLGQGTICSRVYYNDQPYLLTARHLFNGDACSHGTSIIGEPAYRGNDKLGTVDYTWPSHDTAWINLNNSHSITGTIVDENSPVNGWVTKAGISDAQSNDIQYKRRGITTCATTCTVDSYENTYKCGNGEELLEQVYYDSSTYAEDGDSGGPIYWDGDDGNAYIAGLHTGTNTFDCGLFCSDTVNIGPAAYAMNEHYNLAFD